MSTETELLTRFGFSKRRPGFDQVSDTLLSTISKVPDAVVRTIGTFTVVGGTTNALIGPLGPPLNPPEEWELLAAWLIDTAAIDVNDVASFLIVHPDEDGGIGLHPLTPKTIGVISNNFFQNYTIWEYPVTSSSISETTPLALPPWTLRKIALQNRSLEAQVTTTATVGTRQMYLSAYVRRRVI
jgi:hypothetical protein